MVDLMGVALWYTPVRGDLPYFVTLLSCFSTTAPCTNTFSFSIVPSTNVLGARSAERSTNIIQ